MGNITSIQNLFAHDATVQALANIFALLTGGLLIISFVRLLLRTGRQAYDKSIKGRWLFFRRTMIRFAIFLKRQPMAFVASISLLLGIMIASTFSATFLTTLGPPFNDTGLTWYHWKSLLNDLGSVIGLIYLFLFASSFFLLITISRLVFALSLNEYASKQGMRNSPAWMAAARRSQRQRQR